MACVYPCHHLLMWASLRADVAADVDRYRHDGRRGWRQWAEVLNALVHEPALVAVIHYRLGRFGRMRRHSVARLVHALTALPVRLLTGVEIPTSVPIGRGFRIAHYGSTIINGECRIGRNCTLDQGVLLGGYGGAPTLEDGVRVGARAVVVGPVLIGEGAIVGAGSVVLKDVPAGHVAVGNPAVARPPRQNHGT
jgi:serine O-acetyltransferase